MYIMHHIYICIRITMAFQRLREVHFLSPYPALFHPFRFNLSFTLSLSFIRSLSLSFKYAFSPSHIHSFSFSSFFFFVYTFIAIGFIAQQQFPPYELILLTCYYTFSSFPLIYFYYFPPLFSLHPSFLLRLSFHFGSSAIVEEKTSSDFPFFDFVVRSFFFFFCFDSSYSDYREGAILLKRYCSQKKKKKNGGEEAPKERNLQNSSLLFYILFFFHFNFYPYPLLGDRTISLRTSWNLFVEYSVSFHYPRNDKRLRK